MNAAAIQQPYRRRALLSDAGYSWRFAPMDPELRTACCGRGQSVFCVAGIGVGDFGGYYYWETCPGARVGVSFHLRRANAQATSGDVQSRTSLAPHSERSEWLTAELPVVFGVDRAVARADATATAFARHSSLHGMRSSGTVHRGCGITTEATRASAFVRKSSLPAPCAGGDCVVGAFRMGSVDSHAPRTRSIARPPERS